MLLVDKRWAHNVYFVQSQNLPIGYNLTLATVFGFLLCLYFINNRQVTV